jgi:hypothetical protein
VAKNTAASNATVSQCLTEPGDGRDRGFSRRDTPRTTRGKNPRFDGGVRLRAVAWRSALYSSRRFSRHTRDASIRHARHQELSPRRSGELLTERGKRQHPFATGHHFSVFPHGPIKPGSPSTRTPPVLRECVSLAKTGGVSRRLFVGVDPAPRCPRRPRQEQLATRVTN